MKYKILIVFTQISSTELKNITYAYQSTTKKVTPSWEEIKGGARDHECCLGEEPFAWHQYIYDKTFYPKSYKRTIRVTNY